MNPVPSLRDAKRIVIKIGSSLIAESAQLRTAWLAALASDIAQLHGEGREIILVSSGAVALGRPRIGLGAQALGLEEKQAAAAAGQPLLIQAWQQAFDPHGIKVAQLLLTLEDSERRRRYLNARATFTTLLAHRLIPVVNENDTVATAELKFGDNDRLAARVAVMLAADALVLFSDIDGLYDKNPARHPDAQYIPLVENLTSDIHAMAEGPLSTISSGGMKTKLDAAQTVLAAGCHMAIAPGIETHALQRLLAGGTATWFVAREKPQVARKHWMAAAMHVPGAVVIDAGAARALGEGKSLLPAGITAVEGSFERGDIVGVKTSAGALLAKGISNYTHTETTQIMGKKTDAVAAILGYAARATFIHRDDLAML